MSYATGTMPIVATWTLACDQWKPFFESITGFVCTSDTGTGDARVLLFSMRGTTCLLKLAFSYTGYGTALIVKADGATQVISLDRIYFNAVQTYHKVVNTDLSYVYFISSTYKQHYMLLKCGTTPKTYCGKNYMQYAIHSTAETSSDTAFATANIPKSALKMSDNKQLVIPFYPMADSFTQLEATPATNLYTFGNVDAIAANALVSIDSGEYLTITAATTSVHLLCKTSD